MHTGLVGFFFILLVGFADRYDYTAWKGTSVAPSGAKTSDCGQDPGASSAVKVDFSAWGETCTGESTSGETPQQRRKVIPASSHGTAGLEMPAVPTIRQRELPVLSGMRAALAKSGFVRRSRGYYLALALAQFNTLEAFGFAKEARGPRAVAIAQTQGGQAQGQGWPGQRTAEGWQSSYESPGRQHQGDGMGTSFGPISGSRQPAQGDTTGLYSLDAFGGSFGAAELAWGSEQVTGRSAACDQGDYRLPCWWGSLDGEQNMTPPRLLPDSCQEGVAQGANSKTRVLGKLVRLFGQARQDLGRPLGGEGSHPAELRHSGARMGAEAQRGVCSFVQVDSCRQTVGYHFGELGGHGRGRGDGESGDPAVRGAAAVACGDGGEGGCHLRGSESSESGRSGECRHGHANGQRAVSQAAQDGSRPGSQAGGAQEGAPWLGPTCSLMGDVGPSSLDIEPGLPRRHTVEHEPDFTAPPMAGVLGLRREYEVLP